MSPPIALFLLINMKIMKTKQQPSLYVIVAAVMIYDGLTRVIAITAVGFLSEREIS